MDPKVRHDAEGFAPAFFLLFVVFIVICLLCKIVSFISDFFASPSVYKPASRKILAIDTEMVGAGYKGNINMLARVSVVNKYGQCVYDEYVAPVIPVTDYRTFVSGIREEDLIGAKNFYTVQREVRDLIEDCILVGHDLKFDLNALNLSHPFQDIRDTALFKPFRQVPLEKPSLEYISRCLLDRTIQNGKHDSVEDARAAMDIYLQYKDVWNWAEEHSTDFITYTYPNERVRGLQKTNRFFP